MALYTKPGRCKALSITFDKVEGYLENMAKPLYLALFR